MGRSTITWYPSQLGPIADFCSIGWALERSEVEEKIGIVQKWPGGGNSGFDGKNICIL